MQRTNKQLHTHHSRTLIRLAVMATLMMTIRPTTAVGDDINLRASVRLNTDGRIVRLSDIAQLDGDEAQSLGGTVVGEIPADQHVIEYTVDQVRSVLDTAGVHWGRINLNGARVVVRGKRGETGAPMKAMQAVSITGKPGDESRTSQQAAARAGDETTASVIINEQTLRGQIARLFMRQLNRPADAIRLVFEKDQARLLESSTQWAQYEIELRGSPQSTTVPLHVRVWHDEKIVDQHDLVVRPIIAVDAITVTRRIERSEKLTAGDVDIRRLWLPPQEAALLASANSAVGQTATRSLRPGDVIHTQHLKPEVVIQRGDLVEVRCLVGGVVIAMQAQAREDGATGQMIELRKIGERQTFMARVAAPGEATVDLSRQQPQPQSQHQPQQQR